MMAVTTQDAEETLRRRLLVVAPLVEAPTGPIDESTSPIDLLEQMIAAIQLSARADLMWVTLTAVWGCYPAGEDVEFVQRQLELDRPLATSQWILEQGLRKSPTSAASVHLRLVSEQVVAFVSHTAGSDFHTGIQRVIRNTLPHWTSSVPVLPVAWGPKCDAFRPLTERETARVLNWSASRQPPMEHVDTSAEAELEVILPWRCVVALLEVPRVASADPLAGMVRFSGNRMVAIGYDTIPALDPESRHPTEALLYSRYLSVLKHVHRVAAISDAAAEEFRGFVEAVSVQGIDGPIITSCPLGSDPLARDPTSYEVTDSQLSDESDSLDRSLPMILFVGSLDPRKNHLGVLHACETIWSEGTRFRLLLISGSSWGSEERECIDRLRAEGWPLELLSEATDEQLAAAYDSARFSVFPSFHEGYGLPVAESLAHGTPVVTSNYGSTLEAARDGGALFADPRDDQDLTDAIRKLLLDDDLLHKLRNEIRSRPIRRVAEYSAELWDTLIVPELELLRRPSCP